MFQIFAAFIIVSSSPTLASDDLGPVLKQVCAKRFGTGSKTFHACLHGGKLETQEGCSKKFAKNSEGLPPELRGILEAGLKPSDTTPAQAERDATEAKIARETAAIAKAGNRRAACEGGWYIRQYVLAGLKKSQPH